MKQSQIKLTFTHNGKEHEKNFTGVDHIDCKAQEEAYLAGYPGAETIERRIKDN
jgi:hypothetical protein